ncbi:MAG: competence/damage-inducible protein A [Rhodothermales bacterium]|nr:competence/damage-inducible protein A [Rhodothermales bacterium]
MTAHIITVGDELLIGQVINTNVAWLGEQLTLAGVDVTEALTISDDQPVIEAAIARSWAVADLVVVTGGLGPTHDDVTREAVAGFLGVPLVFHQDVLDHVAHLFERFKRTMPESNRSQAMAPLGCEVLHNPVGTAPGLWFAGEHRGRKSALLVVPGVPREMKRIVADHLMPRLATSDSLRTIKHLTIHTLGIGESHLQEQIRDIVATLDPGQRLAYLPDMGSVRLRISSFAKTPEAANRQVESFAARVQERLGAFVVGIDQDVLEQAVGKLLMARGLTVATAESCTGGLIGDRITNISGASEYFKGGVIAYCNSVKSTVLGVSEEVLRHEGAVSEQVAIQMALGVRRLLDADIGLSSTGIMGPGGGTPEKPVGTVWIGYADASGAEAQLIETRRERLPNKQYASMAVLDLLRKKLLV